MTGSNCSLSNIKITAGSALGTALAVTASGDLSLSGANTVMVAGVVATGVDLSAGVNETVLNLETNFENDVLRDAVDIGGSYTVAISNIYIIARENVGDFGLNIGDSGTIASSINLHNFHVQISGTATSAIIAFAHSNLILTGINSVEVKGAVSQSGVDLESYDGDLAISPGLTVQLDSSAECGLEAIADQGNLTMTGSTLFVSGNLSNTGLLLNAGSGVDIQKTAVTLYGTSSSGVGASGNNVTIAGLQLVSKGAVANAGVGVTSYGGDSIVSSSSILLDSSAPYGLQAYADADETVSGVNLKQLSAVGYGESDGFYLQCQGNLSVTHDTITITDGLTGAALAAESEGGDLLIDEDKIVANVDNLANDTGIFTQEQGSLVLENTSVTLTGDATVTVIGVLPTSTSGSTQVIENDMFSTAGAGTGLSFATYSTVNGVPPAVALVQDDNFENNLVGVAITGDYVTAGEVDLGGGPLGSHGGNNFKGFTGIKGHFAITLVKTDNTSAVFAVDNLFNVTTPLTVIQDGTHNSDSVGTGIIYV